MITTHAPVSAIVLLGSFLFLTPFGIAAEAQTCYPSLPTPQLTLRGIEHADSVIYYNLAVTNYASFPPELFQSALDLPPCGLNTNASRTWVDIFADGIRTYGFCGLEVPSDLNLIWFAIPEAGTQPTNASITITDRRCSLTYSSNVIRLRAVPPDEAISRLLSLLLSPSLGLSSGEISALSAKLNAALASIQRGHTRSAANQLRAVVHEIRALERSGRLSSANAALLTSEVKDIIDSL
jgi:hypothetical protein